MQELNAVVFNQFYDEKLAIFLFGGIDETFLRIPDDYNMYDLLVLLGAFSSKSEARKNWTRTGKEIPSGYNEFKDIGKQKKALYIWNPVKYQNNSCNLTQICSISGDCDSECEGFDLKK
jgi:hypothetical protein